MLNRQNRVVSPGGTITRTVMDARDLVVSTWVGTNDAGATWLDPTGGGAPGNNMVVVTENEYDNGMAGGHGNMTQLTQHVRSRFRPTPSLTCRLKSYDRPASLRRPGECGG